MDWYNVALFMGGMFIGGTMGVFVMCLMVIDKRWEDWKWGGALNDK